MSGVDDENDDDLNKVKPVYRDWTVEIPEDDCLPNESKKNSNFPVRLHCLIAEAEKDGQQGIISWQSHGRSFAIHNQKEFVKKLLPLWFRQSKFESFQRQLNIYGFARIQSSRERGCYYHECFLRGMCWLAHRIQRGRPGSKNKNFTSYGPPDFYGLPPLPHTTCHSQDADQNRASTAQQQTACVSSAQGICSNSVATWSSPQNRSSAQSVMAQQQQIGLESVPPLMTQRMIADIYVMNELVWQETNIRLMRMALSSRNETVTSSMSTARDNFYRNLAIACNLAGGVPEDPAANRNLGRAVPSRLAFPPS